MRTLALLALCSCVSLAKEFPAVNPQGRCGNGVMDGNESDVDCGGDQCGACIEGRACTAGSDCVSGLCDGGACQATRCDDGLKGLLESDVDCGGDCAPCGIDERCERDSDCAFARCLEGRCEITLQRIDEAAGGFGVNVAAQGDVVVAGAYQSIVIYEQTGIGLSERATLTTPGSTFALADDTLFTKGASGNVNLYTGVTSLPNNATPAGALSATGDTSFGTLLAATDSLLAVGASGRVHLFNRAAVGWQEATRLEGEPKAIALDGVTLAIAGAASVNVFTRRGGIWSLQQQLLVAGSALALAGDNLLVAAPDASKLYLRTGSQWAEEASFAGTSSNAALADGVLALSHEGSVRLYYRRGPGWAQAASSTLRGAQLGAAMQIVGNQLILGDPAAEEVQVLGPP